MPAMTTSDRAERSTIAPTARPATPPAALLLAAIGAVAVATITTLVGAAAGAPLDFLVLDAVIGAVYLGAGVIAWARRPEVLTGPLLVACCALNFVGSYAPAGLPVLMHLGFAFEGYYDVALAVLVLALPGRWPLGFGRWLALAMLGAFLVRSAGRLLLQDPAMFGFDDLPPNPFVLAGDPAAFIAVETGSNAVIAVVAIAIAIDCLRRIVVSRPVVRRTMWPILVAGVIAMVAAALDAAGYAVSTGTGQPLIDLPEPWSSAFDWSLFLLRLAVPVGFLLGTLRLRRAGGPLVALAVGLGRVPSPVRLESALAAALGDPDVRLVRPDPDGGPSWRAADGTVTAAPTEDAHRAVTMLEHDGRPLAAIVHDPVLREDPALVASVMAVLRLAVENERLDSELQAQLGEVRASRARLVVAAEDERRRIERDLHDGAQQRLVAVALALQQARRAAVGAASPAEIEARLADAGDELQGAIDDLRELARGIHPALLEDEGLPAAVAALARRAGLPVTARIALERRLPRIVEATAYFTVAEALTNATRHAHATQATVELRDGGDRLLVVVEDDGTGGADASRGSGLRGLADRLASVDGRLVIDSPAGGGTRLRAEVPIG
jgi:signal transduction histidine kinase